MSQTAADPAEDDEPVADTDDTDGESPDIEEDLFAEELRIDGICGVY